MENSQDILEQINPEIIRNETKISPKEFKDFKLFLNKIKLIFNDFSLVSGGFRAYSNSRKCLVETGFGFLSDMNFNIANIKSFVKSISTLDKRSHITVKMDNNYIAFEDYIGNVGFRNASAEYIDNKYVSDKEMEEILFKNVDPNKLIVNDAISNKHVCDINKVTRNLKPDNIYFKHEDHDANKGVLLITGRSEDSPVYQLKMLRPLLIPMPQNHYFNFEIIPSLFNKDDMYLQCYLSNDQKMLLIYSTKINDLFVNIYSQSELIKTG